MIAPPTFSVASAHYDPEYPLRPVIGRPWFGSGREPSGESRQGGRLHAEQHFEYHRPLRPGDVLEAETQDGKTWEKQGRSGKLVFSERITEHRNSAGELVLTERSGTATARLDPLP